MSFERVGATDLWVISPDVVSTECVVSTRLHLVLGRSGENARGRRVPVATSLAHVLGFIGGFSSHDRRCVGGFRLALVAAGRYPS
jgi:hypothetical protein